MSDEKNAQPTGEPIAFEPRGDASDARQFSPSAARNRAPILEVLRAHGATQGQALEIASGTGEHAMHIAAALPGLHWRPRDLSAEAHASIAAWTAHLGLENVAPPLAIDAQADHWGVEADAPFDLIVCINMIHISPWESALGLMAGAGRLLRPGATLMLYGPFKRDGVHTAPSNAQFDQSLRARDPQWGVRDVAEVEAAATAEGLVLSTVIAMPANNLSLVFRKT